MQCSHSDDGQRAAFGSCSATSRAATALDSAQQNGAPRGARRQPPWPGRWRSTRRTTRHGDRRLLHRELGQASSRSRGRRGVTAACGAHLGKACRTTRTTTTTATTTTTKRSRTCCLCGHLLDATSGVPGVAATTPFVVATRTAVNRSSSGGSSPPLCAKGGSCIVQRSTEPEDRQSKWRATGRPEGARAVAGGSHVVRGCRDAAPLNDQRALGPCHLEVPHHCDAEGEERRGGKGGKGRAAGTGLCRAATAIGGVEVDAGVVQEEEEEEEQEEAPEGGTSFSRASLWIIYVTADTCSSVSSGGFCISCFSA